MSVPFCVMWETGVKNECETYLCKTGIWGYIEVLIWKFRSVVCICVGLQSTKKRWIFCIMCENDCTVYLHENGVQNEFAVRDLFVSCVKLEGRISAISISTGFCTPFFSGWALAPLKGEEAFQPQGPS